MDLVSWVLLLCLWFLDFYFIGGFSSFILPLALVVEFLEVMELAPVYRNSFGVCLIQSMSVIVESLDIVVPD